MKEDHKYRVIMIGLASVTFMTLVGYILLHVQVWGIGV